MSEALILLPPPVSERISTYNTGWKMTYWLFTKLPAAWFMGVRVGEVDTQAAWATATIPMGWRSQNPFRSIYFAAQAAAAELSTGLLATLALAQYPNRKNSMLVTEFNAQYLKKANTKCTFRCDDGAAVMEAVRTAVETNTPQVLTMTSTGRNQAGDIVSIVRVTWSFK
ncbi:MAG: hypothetical protein RL757_1503 [Bacteroidota bacterium]|jgi:hypothetical protein